MKRAWTRSEKLLWAAPLCFGLIAAAVTFGPQLAARLLGWPQILMTTPDTLLRSMALSRNGEVLAAGGSKYDPTKKAWGSGSGTVHLWNARTGKPLTAIAPVYTRNARGVTTGFDIESLALSPDARQIGISRVSANWALYDVDTRKTLWSFPHLVQDAEFSRDGRWIVLSAYKKIWVVNASSGKVRTQWKRSGSSNSDDVDFSPDGKLVAIIGPYDDDDPIEIYSAENGKLLHRISSKNTVSVKFSPDSTRLIAASSGGNYYPGENYKDFAPLRCYNLTTNTVLWTTWITKSKSQKFDVSFYLNEQFCDAIFSPDGHTIAAYQQRKGKVFLLDSATGAVKTTRSTGLAKPTSIFVPPGLAFSPDGKRLFARGKNAVVYWDLP